ncbi:hypothetical protein PHMEG_00015975 [Phytophthora megakarya]|uniref:Uncharacterized protein n=1 Tax=Phytophthora megakarya TaxID=4795 RepID=A0A225VZX6_9STRA|nr:hypothetical protein PHMEG_00015975 [Phytophthora megakarya]
MGNISGKSGIRTGKWYAGQSSRDKTRFEAIGFNAAVWNHRIIPSIQVFVKTFKHGNVPYNFLLDIYATLHREEETPKDFVIPSDLLDLKKWGRFV